MPISKVKPGKVKKGNSTCREPSDMSRMGSVEVMSLASAKDGGAPSDEVSQKWMPELCTINHFCH